MAANRVSADERLEIETVCVSLVLVEGAIEVSEGADDLVLETCITQDHGYNIATQMLNVVREGRLDLEGDYSWLVSEEVDCGAEW